MKEFLNCMLEQIKYKPICEEIAKEMESHLLEAKENYKEKGMSDEQAEENAIKQMGKAEEIGKKLNQIHRPKLDWKLLINAIFLMCFGVLVLWIKGNTMNRVDGIFLKYGYTLIFGMIGSSLIYFWDYRKILKNAMYLYLLATGLMLITLKFGISVNGVNSWLSIAGFSIPISILVVPLYVLAMIGFLQNIKKESYFTFIFSEKKEVKINKDVFKIILLCGLSLTLLLFMPAMTSMIVLGITYLVMGTVKLLADRRNKIKPLMVLWGIPLLMGILFGIIFMDRMPIQRIITSFHPERDPAGGGWIGMNQKIVLESANPFGKADDMSDALPMFDEGTNFAFLTILAHYGWIPALAMVAMIVTFSIKLMLNAIQIKDMTGKLIIVGISSLFILQSIFNLLMNFNLGMKSDFNIPFISYGNGNLLVNMFSLALVLSVYRKKDLLIYMKKTMEEN